MAQRNKKHDRYLYVKKADFGLFDRFVEKYPRWSEKVMSLIREHMAEGEPDKP